jgi:GxxExxY protein
MNMQRETDVRRQYLNSLSSKVLDAAVRVHNEMGPGLLEAVYQLCMVKELQLRELSISQNVPVPLYYRDQPLNKDYIIDLLVEKEIIIELKAVEGILPVHEAQIISYLKLADKRLGFLINFNVPLLKLGFKRYVNAF